jgi:hypothetical protein
MLILSPLRLAPGQTDLKEQRLSDSQGKAVIQAIVDEIYDYDYQKDFYDIGTPIGKRGTRLTAYVSPMLNDHEGKVIYKLMPYGEVFRLFRIREDGLVTLYGDPEIGFPPTQPNTLTVYLNDDEICTQKRAWNRLQFTIDFSPSDSTIQEVVVRQKKRFGFSIRESAEKSDNSDPRRKNHDRPGAPCSSCDAGERGPSSLCP